MQQGIRPYLRPLGLLITSQALAQSGQTMLVTLSGLVGLALAPQEWMATLPSSAGMLGALLTILPWAWIIQNKGWRPGLLGGLLLGLITSLIAAAALLLNSFLLFTLASLVFGGVRSSLQFHVYAGTEIVTTPSLQRHVIAAVTTAGLVSAFLGPALARNSGAIYAGVPYVGAFIGLAAIMVLSIAAMAAVPLPGPDRAVPAGRLAIAGWSRVREGPVYGILLTAASFGMMTLLMVGAPIAISHEGHGMAVAAGAIQWHLVGMFAPGLLAGGIMNRLGTSLTAFIGVGLSAWAVWLAQHAHTALQFTYVLFLCGVGWSLLFAAGTAVVVETSRPAEKVAIQGLNNLVVSTTSMVAAFAAGPLLAALGYPGLALVTLVPLGVALVALVMVRKYEPKLVGPEAGAAAASDPGTH